MKFLEPVWLLVLLGVLALVAIYLLMQLRRKKYAAKFTNVSLLEKVAPKRPGWRRHLAFALMVAALVCFTTAMAKPATKVKVPRNEATVCMALDVSLSMEATDIKPNRFSAMKDSASDFVDRLPAGINLGLVSFAGAAQVVQTPTIDRNAVKVAIEGLELDQATATGEAIFACLQAIKTFQSEIEKSKEGKVPAARIILLSDGYRTVGREVSTAIDAAKEAKIPVSTIAFGTNGGTITAEDEQIPVPVDVDTMKEIAKETGGSFFNAESAGEIEKVWKDIGEQIGYTYKFQEVPTRFVGWGLLLAFASAAVSLLWSNRLL